MAYTCVDCKLASLYILVRVSRSQLETTGITRIAVQILGASHTTLGSSPHGGEGRIAKFMHMV